MIIYCKWSGILYAVIQEEGQKKFAGFVFLQIADVMTEIKKNTGIEISLDVPDKEGKEWVFRELGKGEIQ